MFKYYKYIPSVFLGFILGMLVFISYFSYMEKESRPKYVYVNPTMDFPKHPVIECQRDIQCRTLAEASYFEARSEDDTGVLMVMKTILNRKAHPRWENSVRGVVYAPKQFSYTHDGSLTRGIKNKKQWTRMLFLAYNLKQGIISTPDEWDNITHYHTKRIKPQWSKHYKELAVVGNHVFYQCKERC